MVDLLELLGTYVGWIYGEDGGGMVGGDRGVCYESICMTRRPFRQCQHLHAGT